MVELLNRGMGESGFDDFRDLEVWQRCEDLRKSVGVTVPLLHGVMFLRGQ